MKMSFKVGVLSLGLFLVLLASSCKPGVDLPPFAGMSGYAYLRADYPAVYFNKVTISADGKTYTNLGNYLTNYTPVISEIISWDAGNMTLYNAQLGLTGTVGWTTDANGLAIFID